jgi:hypothetical protein
MFKAVTRAPGVLLDMGMTKIARAIKGALEHL